MSKNILRELRKQIGWSQFKLEESCQVSRNKIALHEQGYRSLAPEELESVLKCLRKELKRLK